MILGILCLSAAAVASYCAYLIVTSKSDRRKEVLSDLGLSIGIAASLKSPFYKWGWKKSHDDRVWGERIVRETFEKFNIGLGQQDLEFFSQICTRFAAGETIDKASIVAYVDKILSRSVTVSNFAAGFIGPVLERSLSATPAQAHKLLEREKIPSSLENAPDRLAVRQFTKMLRSHGMKIICGEASGLEVKGESGEILTTLHGYDSWEFWLKSCRESLEQCLANKALIKSKTQAKFLRGQIQGIIQNYEEHLKNSRSFIKNAEYMISQEKSPIGIALVQNLERSFYGWHFSETTKFSLQDHKTLHELITLPELPSRCRQALFENITSTYESLQTVCHRFPRYVIFFGISAETRSYAAQQYLLHLNKINKTLSDVLGVKYRPPLFMRILDADIHKARNPDAGDYKPAVRVSHDEESELKEEILVSTNTGYMPLLLDSQKRMILFEKNLDPATAEKIGWIIDLPVDDLTPKESAQMDMGDYIKYKRIDCAKIGNFSNSSDAKSMQNQREKFLNAIFDVLLQGTFIPIYSNEPDDE